MSRSDNGANNNGQGDELERISYFFDHRGGLWIDTYEDEKESWYQYFPLRWRERCACALVNDELAGVAVDLGCGAGHALVKMGGARSRWPRSTSRRARQSATGCARWSGMRGSTVTGH